MFSNFYLPLVSRCAHQRSPHIKRKTHATFCFSGLNFVPRLSVNNHSILRTFVWIFCCCPYYNFFSNFQKKSLKKRKQVEIILVLLLLCIFLSSQEEEKKSVAAAAVVFRLLVLRVSGGNSLELTLCLCWIWIVILLCSYCCFCFVSCFEWAGMVFCFLLLLWWDALL